MRVQIKVVTLRQLYMQGLLTVTRVPLTQSFLQYSIVQGSPNAENLYGALNAYVEVEGLPKVRWPRRAINCYFHLEILQWNNAMELRRNGSAQLNNNYYTKSFCAWLSGPLGPQLYQE